MPTDEDEVISQYFDEVLEFYDIQEVSSLVGTADFTFAFASAAEALRSVQVPGPVVVCRDPRSP